MSEPGPRRAIDRKLDAELVRAAQAGDEGALTTLLDRHRPFVVRLARVACNGALPVEDLVQEGLMGLMEGVRRFDPEHGAGASLIGYSRRWIERAMKRANQRADLRYGGARLPEDVYWAAGRLARAERRLGPGARKDQLASEARIGREEVSVLTSLRARRLESLLSDGETEDGAARRLDRIPDTGAPSALETLLRAEQVELARRALATLPPRWRRLLAGLSPRGKAVRDAADRERQRAIAALRDAYREAQRPVSRRR